MPKIYSQDFRQKAIAAVEIEGWKKSEVSEFFGISRNTLDLWFKLKEQTGSLTPQRTQRVSSHAKITDWEKFRDFAKAHGHLTQEQMAEQWDGDISARTISRALHKIGFTRKKRLMATQNAMKRNVNHFWSN
jgi:transposase